MAGERRIWDGPDSSFTKRVAQAQRLSVIALISYLFFCKIFLSFLCAIPPFLFRVGLFECVCVLSVNDKVEAVY